MSDLSDEELEGVVEVLGRALDLPIRGDNRPIVAAHLRVALGMADVVGSFPLPAEAEPAPVFTA